MSQNKRKSSKASKDSATEEMVESAYDGSTAAQAGAEAFATHMDEDLMGSSFQSLGGAPNIEARDVAPFPSVLGEDSSSSEEIDADEVLASASGSEEVMSGRLSMSMKTPHLEELEAEFVERPTSMRPSNPAPIGMPLRVVGDAMAGSSQGALYLSECFFLFFCFIEFPSPFLCVSLTVACLRSTCDLTKAIREPVEGVVPDLARVGLDAP
jgi:hypothetical protein